MMKDRPARTDDLIERTGGRADPTLDDARRRYYRLTALGKSVMAAETDRLSAPLERSRETQLSPGFAGDGRAA